MQLLIILVGQRMISPCLVLKKFAQELWIHISFVGKKVGSTRNLYN